MSEVKKKLSKADIVFGIILIVLVAFVLTGTNMNNISDILNPTTPEKATPANIELYRYTELPGNKTVTTEIWLKNTGEETGRTINVYVRAINQDGVILLSGNVAVTTTLLQENETNSGVYQITFTNTTKIYSTIEVTWDTGRNTYSRLIEI